MLFVPFIDEWLTGDLSDDPMYEYTDRLTDRPGRTAIGISAIIFFLMTSAGGYSSELGIPNSLMVLMTVGLILGGGVVVYFFARYFGASPTGRQQVLLVQGRVMIE